MESLGGELPNFAIRIFATDLDGDAVDFALREGGYLVLGKTETVSPGANYFVPELPQHRIYRRQSQERPTRRRHELIATSAPGSMTSW